MGISKIASFFGGAKPPSEVAAPDQTDAVSSRQNEITAAKTDEQNLGANPNDVSAQLQSMLSAVRQINDSAVQQGAAMAVSPAGNQLQNAVEGLGHLLSSVSEKNLGGNAKDHLRETGKVMDSVESNVQASMMAAQQMVSQMPAAQASRAKEASDKFQTNMRQSLTQVRDALSSMKS